MPQWARAVAGVVGGLLVLVGFVMWSFEDVYGSGGHNYSVAPIEGSDEVQVIDVDEQAPESSPVVFTGTMAEAEAWMDSHMGRNHVLEALLIGAGIGCVVAAVWPTGRRGRVGAP